MTNFSSQEIEAKLGNFFRLAPSLPKTLKSSIVKYTPYLILITGILAILSSGILNFFIPAWAPKMDKFSLFNYYLQIVFNLIAATIIFLSFKPLANRQYHGWQMIFYLGLLEVFLSLVTLNIAGLFILTSLFYLLFQIREYYQ